MSPVQLRMDDSCSLFFSFFFLSFWLSFHISHFVIFFSSSGLGKKDGEENAFLFFLPFFSSFPDLGTDEQDILNFVHLICIAM